MPLCEELSLSDNRRVRYPCQRGPVIQESGKHVLVPPITMDDRVPTAKHSNDVDQVSMYLCLVC